MPISIGKLRRLQQCSTPDNVFVVLALDHRDELRQALKPIEPDRGWPAGDAAPIAFAGIAQPERFHELLRASGCRVSKLLSFRDHHRYRPGDLVRISSEAVAAGAPAALTTEKDAVRLLPLRPLPLPIAAVPLEVSIEPADRFRAWLWSRLDEARA